MTGIIPRRFRPAAIALALVAMRQPYATATALVRQTRAEPAVAVAAAESEQRADNEANAALRASYRAIIASMTAERDNALAEVEAVREDNAALVKRLAAVKRKPRVAVKRSAAKSRPVVEGGWQTAGASWYGPGFYGNRLKNGEKLSKSTLGVAHRTLPIGTRVAFRNPDNGKTVTVRVVDRGPYVASRMWDLCPGTARALGMYYTGTVQYRVLR
jgi:rare lipoprotein A